MLCIELPWLPKTRAIFIWNVMTWRQNHKTRPMQSELSDKTAPCFWSTISQSVLTSVPGMSWQSYELWSYITYNGSKSQHTNCKFFFCILWYIYFCPNMTFNKTWWLKMDCDFKRLLVNLFVILKEYLDRVWFASMYNDTLRSKER